MTADRGRYAIYFAPEPGSALARFGAAWLGYDVASGEPAPQPVVPRIGAERLCTITAEPRRYGFHATLKPPFALADGTDAKNLAVAVAKLARDSMAFAAPPLQLARVSQFLALTLSAPCPAMHLLADRCVAELDRFRAPPSAAELQRRRRARLSPRQEGVLARWGYPYVMEEFRFHMTLTTRLEAEESAIVEQGLALLLAPLCELPIAIDAIGLFHQPDAGAAFRLMHRYPLGG